MNEKYERAAYRILKRIGANQGYDGFKYSIDIITRIMKEPNRSFVLTGSKGLYAETAKQFKRSGWRQQLHSIRRRGVKGMYFKNHHEVLNTRECLQLYRQLVEFGMLENDPENENRILVFRTVSEETPEEGFYSENISTCAVALPKEV